MSCFTIIRPVYLVLRISFFIFCSLAQGLNDQSAATNVPLGELVHNCAQSCYCFQEVDGLVVRCTGPNVIGVPPNLPADTTVLDISDTDMSVLRRSEISYLKELRHLSLTFNRRLSVIEDQAFHESNLKTIELYGNDLSQFVSDSFGGTKNEISEIDLQSNSRLQKLEAGFLNAFPGLERLHLGNTSIDFNESLFKNLTTMGYDEHFSLLHLNLEYKKIAILDEKVLRYVPNIESIYAGYNHISHIEEHTFIGNPNLKEIHLAWNRLTSVHPSAFSRQRHLRYLDLSGNLLTTLDGKMLDGMPPHAGLCLSFNPLNCNCEGKHLQAWMRQLGRANCLPYSFTQCSLPPELNGQILTDVSPESFCPAEKSTSNLTAWIGLSVILLLISIFMVIGCCVFMYAKSSKAKRRRPQLKRLSSASQTPVLSRQMSNISLENYSSSDAHL